MSGVAGGIRVTVNGEELTLDAGATVATLVEAVGAGPRGIAVAVDGDLVTRRAWGDTPLTGGEHVEILTIAQGG